MKKLTKVITIIDFDDIPAGSVFNAEKEIGEDGTERWSGMWACMACTMFISVPANCCEKWSAKKHDLLFHVRHDLAAQRTARVEKEERGELARLKAKYE